MSPPPKKEKRRLEEGESYSPASAERNGDPREPLPEGPGWERRDAEGDFPPPKTPEEEEEFEKELGKYLMDLEQQRRTDYWHPPWMQGELPPEPRSEWDAISSAVDAKAADEKDKEKHYGAGPVRGPYVAPRPWTPPQQYRDSPTAKLERRLEQIREDSGVYGRDLKNMHPPPPPPEPQPPGDDWSPARGWPPHYIPEEDRTPEPVLPRVPGMYTPLSESQWEANRRRLLKGLPLAPEGLDPELYFRENQELLPPHLRETEDQKRMRELEEREFRNRNRM